MNANVLTDFVFNSCPGVVVLEGGCPKGYLSGGSCLGGSCPRGWLS